MLQEKLSSNFQLSIPKAMRNSLDLKADQQFTLIAQGRIIELISAADCQRSKRNAFRL